MNNLITIQNVSHQYGDKQVLTDINLTVQQNEIIAILGPSGSGKSTLINIIGGLLKQTSGVVYINDKKVMTTGHVSFMPQTSSLMPWRTVEDNIKLATEIGKQNSQDQSLSLLERAGFIGIKDQYPSSLSGGMKQRVSFLRALNTNHHVLLLDEPFSALDEITRVDMQQWLKGLIKESGKTVLMITHSIEEAISMSDRIIVLNGKPATITQIYDTQAIQNETEKQALKLRLFDQLR
ncbi:ABC transporter ATP-binding protein [Macrococcoides goetzii]|nr:ABC transporter ATP-binding protein [Macrococcus goetzii]TDM42253.1 ABC transporter ATP-binding protein [Macrococcus goetzii]TDM47812.1 ABC transporter ATP-binding protein [Macrococcus goetzii]TDM51094.1 ABC transporter ATP-binding protein [Macrococcus goetzii]